MLFLWHLHESLHSRTCRPPSCSGDRQGEPAAKLRAPAPEPPDQSQAFVIAPTGRSQRKDQLLHVELAKSSPYPDWTNLRGLQAVFFALAPEFLSLDQNLKDIGTGFDQGKRQRAEERRAQARHFPLGRQMAPKRNDSSGSLVKNPVKRMV